MNLFSARTFSAQTLGVQTLSVQTRLAADWTLFRLTLAYVFVAGLRIVSEWWFTMARNLGFSSRGVGQDLQ